MLYDVRKFDPARERASRARRHRDRRQHARARLRPAGAHGLQHLPHRRAGQNDPALAGLLRRDDHRRVDRGRLLLELLPPHQIRPVPADRPILSSGLFNFNLVSTLFGDMSILSRIVYVLVGISAISTLITMPRNN